MTSRKNGGQGASGAPLVQALTQTTMNFLSTARGETLGACAVSLAAVTYLVLGRVGLVLIGAAGGVVWHATWDDQQTRARASDGAEKQRRKELSLDIVQRLLALQEKRHSAGGAEEEDSKAGADSILASAKELNFSEFPPETRSALTALVDTVIRDYVKWWYSPVLPQEVLFPYTCRQTLTAFLLSISRHVARKRPADAFLNFLTNSTSIFIVFLSELSNALMAPGMYERDVNEAIKLYLAEKPDSSLANLMNRDEQEKKFQGIAKDILQTYLDSKTYNCEPARVFCEQILAGLILETVLHNSSQGFWINDWIIYLFEEGEPELMNAIDAGVGSAAGGDASPVTTGGAAAKNNQISGHARRASKAEQEMDEAMAEVKRLNDMIAEEEARKSKERDAADDATSTRSTDQVATPTSSQSERHSGEDDTVPPALELTDESKPEEPKRDVPRAFTSFDQILPPQHDNSDSSEPPPLTLHLARITLFDDEKPGEKGTFRSKPNVEYLLQIEPASSQHSGWMAARKYTDFETLHEFTSRVAKISGITTFSVKHATAPTWKGKSKATLRNDLEMYMKDALSHEGLAESEGMKRFLEKEKALNRPEPQKGVLGFPSQDAFQNMGKGMLDAMTAAPKGVAGSGQALFKGVQGVFTGPKRTPSNSSQPQQRDFNRTDSTSSQEPSSSQPSLGATSAFLPRPSRDSFGASPDASTDSLQAPPLPSRPTASSNKRDSMGLAMDGTRRSEPHPDSYSSDLGDLSHSEPALASQSAATPINLPPPPSDITDDFDGTWSSTARVAHPWNEASSQSAAAAPSSPTSLNSPATEGLAAPIAPSSPPKISTTDDLDPVAASSKLSPPPAPPSAAPLEAAEASSASPSATPSQRPAQQHQPINTDETSIALELVFAIINELYTLSSAWQIRRTLLNTAKAFLLRPGNASLASIRRLLQESVLDAHLSDRGIATQLRTLRANAMPTEAELAAWPVWPPTADTQQRMREKARRLFLAQGVPPALTGIMGAQASAEALARVFDALQVEEVARGLMFALLLQGIRAVTH